MDYMTVPGLGMTDPERLLLHDMAAEISARFGADCTIVNIGVAGGASCACLRAGAPYASIYGIDVDQDSARGDWLFIHADSRRYHLHFDKPVHLLFVDGDHDYYGVKADILGWGPKVAAGGVVMFHDYGNGDKAPHTVGVKYAVDQLMSLAEWEIIGSADSILMCRKKDRGPDNDS